MVLRDLIAYLETVPPDAVVPIGFTNPHSYRGVYEDLAFEPERNVTARDMLADARLALGATYTAYKGGEYTMGEWTTVHLASWGRTGEEIGPVLLAYMFGRTDEVQV